MNKNSRKYFYFSFICLLSSYFLLSSHLFGFFTHCREASFLFMVHFTVTAESLNILGCTLHILALLTASFFENGPMPTPTKLGNQTFVGSGDPDSAQWSQPCRFRHWSPSSSNFQVYFNRASYIFKVLNRFCL